MPSEMGYDYLGISYQDKKAQQGVSPTVVFGMSLIFVFLILAALYESCSVFCLEPLSQCLAHSQRFGCEACKTTFTRKSV